MKDLELSIIIVDYKSEKYSIPLVYDLEKKLRKLNFEIIVVDNDPAGEAEKKLSEEFKKYSNVLVIKAKENKGYGSGNNLGEKQASGKYLLLLNPDTEVVDDAIEKMLDFLAKHSEVGAVTPLLYYPNGEFQRHFFADFQSLAGITVKRWKGRQADLSKEFFYSEMITGAAMMLKRELYEKLGGFDENFFMYIEDDDLCRRIGQQNLKCAVLTKAVVIHHEGQSSTSHEKKRFYYKSQDYYWQKHYGSLMTALMKVIRAPYVLLQKLR